MLAPNAPAPDTLERLIPTACLDAPTHTVEAAARLHLLGALRTKPQQTLQLTLALLPSTCMCTCPSHAFRSNHVGRLGAIRVPLHSFT